MDRINNALYYLLIVLIIGIASYFFHSYLLAVVVIIFVLLPIFSFILLRLSAKGVNISLKNNDSVCKRSEEYILRVTIINKTIVPVLNYNFKIEMENSFAQQSQTRYINASVPALGKRVLEFSIKPTLCGRVNVSIAEVAVRDFLSFFQYKMDSASKFSFDVLPRKIKIANNDLTSSSVADESENAHKDSAGTEVVDIREYLMGDSLKTIHWKLSAKKDELFVREKGDSIVDRPILLFELNRKDINGILDIVYAVARHYIKQNQPIRVCWAGGGSEQLISRVVYAKEDINSLFKSVYDSLATNDEGHSLSVAKRQFTGGSILYVESAEKGACVIDL